MKYFKIDKQFYTIHGETRRTDMISVGKKLTIVIFRKSRLLKRIRVDKDKLTGITFVFCHLPF